MSEQDKREEAGFEARTRSLFAESVESLDGRTRSRLTQARNAALEALPSRGAPRWRRAWIALSGVTAAAVLAVWVTLGSGGNQTQSQELRAVMLDDLDIVADATELDLLEDVEFYAWVAQERS